MGRGTRTNKGNRQIVAPGIRLANKSERLGKQLWRGVLPEKSRFVPIKNHSHPKPISGGLWTSTEIAPGVSSFSDWIDIECDSLWKGSRPEDIWEAIPRRDANVYQIDALEDLEYIQDKYPVENTSVYKRFEKVFGSESMSHLRISLPVFDYEAFAEDRIYDGFHVTDAAIRSEELADDGFISIFRGWDRESILWAHWAFEGFKKV